MRLKAGLRFSIGGVIVLLNHLLFSVCVQLTIVQCLCPADNLQKNMETFVVKMCNAVH